MTLRAVFLKSAEADIRELRAYVVKNFGKAAWQSTYGELKGAVALIESFPEGGAIPDELRNLNLHQYRQVVSGMNRLIYRVDANTAYIYVVCDTRRDFKSLLLRRLIGRS